MPPRQMIHDDPFYFLAEERRATECPVAVGRKDAARGCADGGTPEAVGFKNLARIFSNFERLCERSVALYSEPIPAIHTDMFRRLVTTSLPLIFGDEYEKYVHVLKGMFEVDRIRRFAVCMLPRRFGKSTNIAMFVSCLAGAVRLKEPLTVLVISMQNDVSKNMSDAIVEFLQILTPDIRFTIKNQQVVEFFNEQGICVTIHCKIAKSVSFFV